MWLRPLHLVHACAQVYSSDNGGSISNHGGFAGNNWPLRSGKMTNFEGGVRVPAFITGGLVPMRMRGKTLDGYIAMADWYSTMLSIAGVPDDAKSVGDPDDLPAVDGLNMWPYLSGEAEASPRNEIVRARAARAARTVHRDTRCVPCTAHAHTARP